jgi:hypothetical protein
LGLEITAPPLLKGSVTARGRDRGRPSLISYIRP